MTEQDVEYLFECARNAANTFAAGFRDSAEVNDD